MTTPADLEQEAARFAALLSHVLNSSVCRGVALDSLLITPDDQRDRERVLVADGLADAPTPEPIPLSVAEDPEERRRAPTWLTLEFRLMLDEEGRYLAVHSSTMGLCIWPDTGRSVVRIEFDRDKRRHPAAHVHIEGASLELGYAWGALGHSLPKRLADLHFPVGGLRYRPSLEDFVEFLIAEGLVGGFHDGWREALDESREQYERIQLKAAVRHDPDAAYEALEAAGFLADADEGRPRRS